MADDLVIRRFGSEWSRFDHHEFSGSDFQVLFERYFRLFPWASLPPQAEGFDMGCGTGRWAKGVAPRVGTLHCIDPASEALAVARRNLAGFDNCLFHEAGVDDPPLAAGSADFGYSLGVLHHLRDPAAGLRACVDLLKPGAPLLIYVYYALDQRPTWFRAAWRGADIMRRAISRLPDTPRQLVCDTIAALVYWPLARGAGVLERAGADVVGLPLSQYRDRSFYVMRTDALDRFGTPIEHRFTRERLREMMDSSDLVDIRIGDDEPYWCAVGFRRVV